MTKELIDNLDEAIADLATALNEMRDAATEHAITEHKYRQAKARTFVRYAEDGTKRIADHLNALVDLGCDDLMLKAKLAKARHESANECVRSLRTTVSALQTILNGNKAEAEAVSYRQYSGA